MTDIYDEIALKIKGLEKENAKLKKQLNCKEIMTKADYERKEPPIIKELEKLKNDSKNQYVFISHDELIDLFNYIRGE